MIGKALKTPRQHHVITTEEMEKEIIIIPLPPTRGDDALPKNEKDKDGLLDGEYRSTDTTGSAGSPPPGSAAPSRAEIANAIRTHKTNQ